jgi:hypothetical protein
MLEKVKMSLRITHDALDSDISDTIDACKRDLSISGVEIIEDTDELIIQACKTYARAEYDFGGKGEKYKESYELLKQHLSLCGDYKVVVEVVD